MKIKGTVERREGNRVVIITDERESINLPLGAMPKGFKLNGRIEIEVRLLGQGKKPDIDDLFA